MYILSQLKLNFIKKVEFNKILADFNKIYINFKITFICFKNLFKF